MTTPVFLGEFEQLVLLALLQVARELRDSVPVPSCSKIQPRLKLPGERSGSGAHRGSPVR